MTDFPHAPRNADFRCPDCGFDLATFNDDGNCPAKMRLRIAELETQYISTLARWVNAAAKLEHVATVLNAAPPEARIAISRGIERAARGHTKEQLVAYLSRHLPTNFPHYAPGQVPYAGAPNVEDETE